MKATLTNNNIEDPEVVKLLSKFSSKCPNLPEKLAQLREKIVADQVLKDKGLDDAFLLRFLNVRNFDVESTCDLIDGYFTMRREFGDYFKLPSELSSIYDDQIVTLLPDESCEGKAMLFFKPSNWNPQEIPAKNLISSPMPFFEFWSQTHGELEVTEIFDCSNIEFRHFLAVPVSVHKVAANLTERALPVKYAKIHIVNEGKLVDMLWAIAKPFFSEEIKKKLVFHGNNYKTLLEAVDASFVPTHLGGQLNLEKCKLSPDKLAHMEEKIKNYWQKYSAE